MRSMKMFSLALLALLAACGGGGGGSGSQDTISVTFDYGAPRRQAMYTAVYTGDPVGTVPGAHFAVVSGALAPGVELDASTGAINGVPTQPGSYSATVELTIQGYSGSAKSTFQQSVVDVSLDPAPITTFHAGGSFFFQLGSLDAPDTEGVTEDAPHGVDLVYRMAAGSVLPTPLVLDAHSGLISGIEGLPVGVYPQLVLEAVVTVAGVSHVYSQPAVTLTLLPQGT